MLLRSTLRALDQLATKLGRSPERAPHLVSGARGEDEAYFYLRKLGYTIVAATTALRVVEVKTRSSRSFMPAEAAVDDEKRETLSALAREFLRNYLHAQGKSPQFRFDVISVYLEGNRPEITLFRDAFRMS